MGDRSRAPARLYACAPRLPAFSASPSWHAAANLFIKTLALGRQRIKLIHHKEHENIHALQVRMAKREKTPPDTSSDDDDSWDDYIRHLRTIGSTLKYRILDLKTRDHDIRKSLASCVYCKGG